MPMDGVDWKATQKFERSEIQVALRSIESAVDRLLKADDVMDATLPEQWRIVIRSAAHLGRFACDEARKEGWFDDRFGVIQGAYITRCWRKAVGWLSFLSDVMTHGQRVSKLLTCEDFREEVVVPAGDLHLASQTFFERMMLESRDGKAS